MRHLKQSVGLAALAMVLGTQPIVAFATAPVLTGAVSRKIHWIPEVYGGPAPFDIAIGAGDIECRSFQLITTYPNELTIIATFDIDVAVLGDAAAVQTDLGTVSSVTRTGVGEVTIDMTDLPLNGQVNLGFNDGVNGIVDAAYPTDPATASNSTLCVRIIVGDYDNNGRTNFIDFFKIKAARYIGMLVGTCPAVFPDCGIYDPLDHARADFDCSCRPDFLDFARVRNAGLINQTAPACTTPIVP